MAFIYGIYLWHLFMAFMAQIMAQGISSALQMMNLCHVGTGRAAEHSSLEPHRRFSVGAPYAISA
jgi:hypothetical protein